MKTSARTYPRDNGSDHGGCVTMLMWCGVAVVAGVVVVWLVVVIKNNNNNKGDEYDDHDKE